MSRNKSLWAALAALAAVGLCIEARAASLNAGQWQGVIRNPSQNMPVTLEIAATGGGTLQFGAPALCRLNLAFVARRPNGWTYKMESPMGGRFCDSLHGGDAVLDPVGNSTIRAYLASPHTRQHFTLTPAAR